MLFASEMTKDFSKPILAIQNPIPVYEALQADHDELVSQQKLTRILR